MDEEDCSSHSPTKKVKSSSNQTVMKTKTVVENIEKVPDHEDLLHLFQIDAAEKQDPQIIIDSADEIDKSEDVITSSSIWPEEESKINSKLATENILKDPLISEKLKNKNNSMEEFPVRNSKRYPEKIKVNYVEMDEEDCSSQSPKKKVISSSNQTVMKTKTVEEKPTNIEKIPDTVEESEDGEDDGTSKSDSNEINDSITTNNPRKLRDRGNNNNTVKEVKEGAQCCSNQSSSDTKAAAKDHKKIKKKPSSLCDLSLRAFMANDDIREESEDSKKELAVSKKELKMQKECIVKLTNLFIVNQINFKPRRPTRADGNCWFRSIIDQLDLHQVPDLPTTHEQLRIEVANFLSHLPENVTQEWTELFFKGKRQGLKSLAYRQKKPGQFVDDNGIMVITTARFVGRRIHLHRENLGVPVILQDTPGGEGSENFPPLNVFYFQAEQHYQSICKTNSSY